MNMKEAYQKKLQAQLNEWNAEIDMLKAKADGAEVDAQLEYSKQIEELHTMQVSANSKITEMKEANDTTWEELKAGIDCAWNSLSKAVKSACSKFK